MRLRADLAVGRPAADVWAAIASPEGAACLPGLDAAAGTFTLTVETGALVLEGTADLASDPRARTVTVDARGAGPGGRARATVMARVGDDGLFSTIDLEAEVTLSGDLAGGSRLVAEALYRLADEWAGCLEQSLGAGTGRPPEPAPEPRAEEEPRGWWGRLLRRIRGG